MDTEKKGRARQEFMLRLARFQVQGLTPDEVWRQAVGEGWAGLERETVKDAIEATAKLINLPLRCVPGQEVS